MDWLGGVLWSVPVLIYCNDACNLWMAHITHCISHEYYCAALFIFCIMYLFVVPCTLYGTRYLYHAYTLSKNIWFLFVLQERTGWTCKQLCVGKERECNGGVFYYFMCISRRWVMHAAVWDTPDPVWLAFLGVNSHSSFIRTEDDTPARIKFYFFNCVDLLLSSMVECYLLHL